MKKATFIVVVFLCVGLISTKVFAIPTELHIYSTDRVSNLYVDGLGLLRAGEFRFVLNPGPNEYETVSYCVDPYQTFNPNSDYTVGPQGYFQILSLETYSNENASVTYDEIASAAHMMNKYAPGLNSASTHFSYNSKDIAAGLQLALWYKLYGLTASDENADNILAVYNAIIDDQAGHVPDGFFVAYSGMKQDQLFGAAPVPEPATMMLLGTGLLGLGIVSRRKLRK